MAADYLIASLQPLTFDGAAPYTKARFVEMCRDQLAARDADAIAALLETGLGTPSTPIAAKWVDLETQMRNAVATARAQALGQDAARWQHPTTGCALAWTNRIASAFQEKDTGRRDRLLDLVRWDAAGELTPPAAPLSAAAAYTYAIRLGIVLRRQHLSTEAGNAAFTRLTAATKLELDAAPAKENSI